MRGPKSLPRSAVFSRLYSQRSTDLIGRPQSRCWHARGMTVYERRQRTRLRLRLGAKLSPEDARLNASFSGYGILRRPHTRERR